MYGAVCGAEFAVNDVVKYGLEVVEEDGIGGALEDESEAPVWVDAAAGCNTCGRYCGIGEEEGYRKKLHWC